MNFLDKLFDKFKGCDIANLTEELKIQYILYLEKKHKSNVIVLTSTLYEATKIYNDLRTYKSNVLFFPMDDFLTSVAIAISPELKIKRVETLNVVNTFDSCIVITNLMGFLRYIPNNIQFEQAIRTIKIGDIVNRQKLEENLQQYGYEKASLVTSSGEYSIRGFVIDIFPYDYDTPIRIELFGNQVEKIRKFDYETQLTTENIDNFKLSPYSEILGENTTNLYHYMKDPLIVKIDPELINQENLNICTQINDYNLTKNVNTIPKYMENYEDINIIQEYNLYDFNSESDVPNIECKNIENFDGNLELLKKYIDQNINKYYIILATKNKKVISYFEENFDKSLINFKDLQKNKLNFLALTINKGFVVDEYIVISDNDIESKIVSNYYHNPVKIGRKVKDFNDLKIGDFVVHSLYGIGIYGGVISLTKNEYIKDYILINYAGSDKVYIPVEKINSIYKYSDAEGQKPKINKLNSTQWVKTKLAVKSKIKDISEQLLKLYASRANIRKEKYKSFPEDTIFASQFQYELTRDQDKSINEIITDLKKDLPMDRLLCGDVGFGKTEVAFRAIFNTVMNGYQVAYLCPTTILSKQHFQNALSRFKNFPINIALANRFTTNKNFNTIIQKLAEGKLDIVFGTHKLFNQKIKYKKLGLLVIDEEQRFGVLHKEKIKELKNNINVLTLSATPIPRTLKMAMSGLKDLSILDTAPANRYPIQTYVIERNDILIKDAIYKELSRSGQVYYLFNNIKKIEDETNKIRKLVPSAKVSYAHGQMPKRQLESIIEDFVNNKFDILVCTTIIETGIDISNVNTLIVIDAQNYGLSQLYQLRGRVGRSDKIAYAYLTYNQGKNLNDTAYKRLKAIKEFTELGSGYKIAMRDLSIRGAGDLLGSEQAGFVSSVGLEMYTKMVHDTLNELKGIYEEEDTSLTSLIDVDTHIEKNYIPDETVRIEIHKLINTINNYDTLTKIKDEVEDRFGQISDKLEIYMYEEWFENLATKLNIKNVIQTKEKIEVQFPTDISNKINGEKLFLQAYSINPYFKIRYQNKRISVTLPITRLDNHYIYYLVELLDKIINDIE